MANYKTPNLNSIAGPRAGGDYLDMLTQSLPNPVVTGGLSGAPTSITSVGSGNATPINAAKKTSAPTSSPLIDAAKIAAVLGGGALAANAIKDAINKPTKPTTPTIPVTPTKPVVPTAPTIPTTPTVPTAPVYEYPQGPNGETPYDDEGNLNAGFELDENNNPVWVGITPPATQPTGGLNQTTTIPSTTPSTVPVEESLAPNEQLVPKDVTPSPVIPTGGLNQTSNTPTAPAVAPPVTTTPSANVSQPVTNPTATPPAAESNPVNTQPDDHGFVDYMGDEQGNTYGITADGQYFLISSASSASTTSEAPAETTTGGLNSVSEQTPAEPEIVQDDAGNVYKVIDGQYYLIESVNDSMDYTPPDTTDDVPEVAKGGLMMLKNGGIPRYAQGDSVYGSDYGVDIPDVNVNDATMDTGLEAPSTLSNPVYDNSGTGETTSGFTDADGNQFSADGTPIFDNTGVGPLNGDYTDSKGNTYSKNGDGNYVLTSGPATTSITDKLKGGLGSATDFLKGNPLAGGAVAALVMQLLSKATGGGGNNYKPDMSALAIKPHTTDFGMGPARVVASGSQAPYYSPEQATQLNTNLGVAGFPTAYQQTQTTPTAAQGGLASGGIVAASNHYSYGKPVDPLEVMGVRDPAVSNEPQTQAVRKGGSMHPQGPLGVPMKEGRHDYRQGAAVNGPGDGQSDDIPAMLADGEYVIDAELVSMLGNGSNKAGAQYLDRFRQSVREHKRSAPLDKIPPKTKSPLAYMKGLK